MAYQQSRKAAKNKRKSEACIAKLAVVATLLMMSASTLVLAKGDEFPVLLPEVVITGRKDEQNRTLSSPKFVKPIQDTPQSITVVPKKLLEEQNVTTLRDAVRNVSGISIAAGEGGFQGDSLTLRGFSARNDMFLDGMRDFGSYARDSFNTENVEVLKGPSSVAFGRGSTGGVVNQVSKMANLDPSGEIEAMVGTNQKQRLSLDINTPLGDTSALRVNALGESSRVADRDTTQTKRAGLATSLAFGIGTDTRWNFGVFQLDADDIPDYGIPWLFNKPAPVARRNFYGFNDDFLKTTASVATAKVEHDFSHNTTIRDQLRYGNYTRNLRISEARPVASTTPTTPLTNISIDRNEINREGGDMFLQNQLDVTRRFSTGVVHHNLTAGLEVGRETSELTRYTVTGVPTANLLAPPTAPAFTGTYTAPRRTTAVVDTVALYLMDVVELSKRWELTGGLRWDNLSSSFQDSLGSLNLTAIDSMVSWRGAVVFKPMETGSVYLGYGTSFNPSVESLSLTTGSSGLSAERNSSVELGTKWELMEKKWLLRSAIFHTQKDNARETSPTNSNVVVLGGTQKVDGFELELAGHITRQWDLNVAYAFLKSQVMSSTFFPGAVGQPLANAPRNTLSVWSTYTFQSKLQIGGGGNFVDSRRASSTVPNDPTTNLPKEAPGYWVFNAMAAYPIGRNTDLQLNVYNLADTYYYDQIHPSHIVPGEGRTVLLSVKWTL